jgi:hypothetical protein
MLRGAMLSLCLFPDSKMKTLLSIMGNLRMRMLKEGCAGEGRSTDFTFADCSCSLLGTVSFAHESPPVNG